jgi:hypothetical protein
MKRQTGQFDRAELRKMTGEAVKNVRRDFAQARKELDQLETLVAKTLRDASSAGVASAAMAARVASGMLAGIADTLARKSARKAR